MNKTELLKKLQVRAKNLFVTGLPGVGKTTLVVEVFKTFPSKIAGFYTIEVRQQTVRKGFKICSTLAEQEIFAWKGLDSNYKVGSYGVDIKVLENIGIKSMLYALENKEIILVDEIGKMECFSEKFKEVLLKCLDSSKKVLATIKLTSDTFIDKLKSRSDTQVLELTRQNYDYIKQIIFNWINSDKN